MLMADQALGAAGAHPLLGRFSVWMSAEQSRILRLCCRLLDDPDEASSAAQDTFLKAYLALEKNSVEITEPGHWLTRIAVNVCLDRLRSRRWQFWRRRPDAEREPGILAAAVATGPDAEDLIFARQVSARLQTGLRRLSGRQRAVFVLKHYEDKSLEEIAIELELDVGTVKAHLSRALAKLRIELGQLYGMRRR
jgi:RNA polymerase sigma-70 factor (ECF subfamily)